MADQSVGFDPFAILETLERRHVTYIVIGALARVIHGTGELTRGVDITPSMRQSNLSWLENALRDLDGERVDGKPLDLQNIAEPVIEVGTRAGLVKVVPIPAGSRGYDDLRWHASGEPVGEGIRPQVASPGDLARMLGAMNRDDQIPTLLRLRRLIELGRERGLGIER